MRASCVTMRMQYAYRIPAAVYRGRRAGAGTECMKIWMHAKIKGDQKLVVHTTWCYRRAALIAFEVSPITQLDLACFVPLSDEGSAIHFPWRSLARPRGDTSTKVPVLFPQLIQIAWYQL